MWCVSVQLDQMHRHKSPPLIFAQGVGDAGRMKTAENMQVSYCVYCVAFVLRV